ncbi:hypothetical protein KQX54_007638 [Cotesia glomerata]|uniref:Uncharacterized protein n=1 Tax=Cotesia glomerata TaxID=32391 RepID=A0AAV7INE8_COTGL|nr:hypothetical protein KQX54_007638 [Cotesia glomerata]
MPTSTGLAEAQDQNYAEKDKDKCLQHIFMCTSLCIQQARIEGGTSASQFCIPGSTGLEKRYNLDSGKLVYEPL